MKRPNFLLITSDQQRADCMGFMGRKIKTPHLDALARRGMHFPGCITPTVVCQPARASILTGQLCRTHGVHDNGIDLDPAIGEKGFAGALTAAGYRSAFFGKAHFATYHTFAPTGTPECLRSSADYGDDWYGPYMGFEYIELVLVGHNWFPPEKPPAGQHYERFFHSKGQGDERLRLYRENAGDTKGAAQTWHSMLPVAWHNSTWTADRALEWLSRTQDDERPFCAWVSFPDPHHPFDCPEPWSRLHPAAEVDLPPYRERDLEKRPWWHEAAVSNEPKGDNKNVDIRKNYSRIGPQSDEQLREIIANTYGQISLIDHQIGRICDYLDRSGLSENTIVVYSSDHGDWLGDHGLILKGPMHYEGLLKVPMLISGPGIPAGVSVPDPVSTLDLGATFFDYADTKAMLEQHGRSLKPVIEGVERRSYALNEWGLGANRVGVALELRTVHEGDCKLTLELNSGTGELYDLSNDPYENENLFDKPSAADIRTRLISRIEERPDDMIPLQTPVGTA